jgi:hypothetical protein
MRRDEYKASRIKGLKTMISLILSYLFVWGMLFTVFVSSYFLMELDKRHYTSVAIVVISVVVTFVLPILWISKKVLGSYGLICQKCGKELTEDPRIPITGECPQCHANIFQDANQK